MAREQLIDRDSLVGDCNSVCLEPGFRDPLVLAAEREVAKKLAQTSVIQSLLANEETELKQSREDLQSLVAKLESQQLRQIEQVLKQNLDWYLPLEEILGQPLWGITENDFYSKLRNRQFKIGVSVSRYCRSEPSSTDGDLLLDIYPRHTERYGRNDGHYGPSVPIVILPDNTLRPTAIYNYNRLFPYDPKVDTNSGVDIRLISASGSWRNLSGRRFCRVMYVNEWRSGVDTPWDRSGVVRSYDNKGQLQTTRNYEAERELVSGW